MKIGRHNVRQQREIGTLGLGSTVVDAWIGLVEKLGNVSAQRSNELIQNIEKLSL
jgi:hypothetical protein